MYFKAKNCTHYLGSLYLDHHAEESYILFLPSATACIFESMVFSRNAVVELSREITVPAEIVGLAEALKSVKTSNILRYTYMENEVIWPKRYDDCGRVDGDLRGS